MSTPPTPVLVPLFMTEHAPVGAWMSLIFGAPAQGVTIRQELSEFTGDLLVGVHREGAIHALPFIRNPSDYSAWQFVGPNEIQRTLSPCIDEWTAAHAGITLRVLTPQPALPNPKRSGNLQFATAPGLLLELVIDNSNSEQPAVGFIGLRTTPGIALRPLDWSSKTLRGVGQGSRWILAAAAAKEELITVQTHHLADLFSAPALDPSGPIGGIAIRVSPRTTKTVALAIAGYLPGFATQGIDARYAYTSHFPRIEAVANFLLHNRERIRESCLSFDARTAPSLNDPHKTVTCARGIRAYNASTQVIEGTALPLGAAGPASWFATIDPASARRCPLDLAADHLPWELFRNPWVIRNAFDLATTTYAYHDRVRFPEDSQSPDEWRTGGMTFARDFGFGSAYAPGASPSTQPGTSAFDGAGTSPGWSGGKMATEVLLNSIYMLTSYALLADDTPWARTRLPFARELMVSLENRDHWDPEKRNGILKADSEGAAGEEQTALATIAGAPPELTRARGNLYLAIKTFCANLLLTTYFQNNNDLHSADFSYAFAQKTAASIVAAFKDFLPANLLSTDALPGARMLAALEPLALPTYLGLTSTLAEYFPQLFQALKAHAEACLKPAPEGCMDSGSAALRLISTSPATDPGKAVAILFVLERLFQLDAGGHAPAIWDKLSNTPGQDDRLITAALYLKPA